MKLLLTGGGGQLGRELAELLAAAGVPFDAPGRDQLDLARPETLDAAFAGPEPPTAVLHAGAETRVDLCETERELAFTVNGAATERLARRCGERSLPLLYVSTDFVFDGRKGAPYEVDDPPNPLSVYGASKLAGEEAVRRCAPRHYVVRTAWVFGPHGQNFPRAMLNAAASGRPLRVVDDQTGAPTYARDLAAALLALLGIGRSAPAPAGTYHFTNAGACTWHAFAEAIFRQAGWDVPVARISSAELARPAVRPAYSVLSLESVRRVGIEPRPWEAALHEHLARLRPLTPELFLSGSR